MTEAQFLFYAEKYQHTVFRAALGCLRDPTESEDVTQTVLLKLFQTSTSFQDEDHVKFWLLRVTINECRRLIRSPWRRVEPLENWEDLPDFPSLEHSNLFFAVNALPDKYRIPIYLYYYEGYSGQEIAQLLHLPAATVRTRLRRGREALKHTLEETDDETI